MSSPTDDHYRKRQLRAEIARRRRRIDHRLVPIVRGGRWIVSLPGLTRRRTTSIAGLSACAAVIAWGASRLKQYACWFWRGSGRDEENVSDKEPADGGESNGEERAAGST